MTEPTTPESLRSFLESIKEKMGDESASPIYCMSAMNMVFNAPGIEDLLTEENRELSRDIWLRLDAIGLQLRKPPLLFEEGSA